jgi:hypothetical protein
MAARQEVHADAAESETDDRHRDGAADASMKPAVH